MKERSSWKGWQLSFPSQQMSWGWTSVGWGGHRTRTGNVCQAAEPSVCLLLPEMVQSGGAVVAPSWPGSSVLCHAEWLSADVDVYVGWWMVCNDRLLTVRVSPVCLLPRDNHTFSRDSLAASWCCSVNPAVHLTFKHNLPWLFSKCH